MIQSKIPITRNPWGTRRGILRLPAIALVTIAIVLSLLTLRCCFFETCKEFTPKSQLQGPVQQEWVAHYHIGASGIMESYKEGPHDIAVDSCGNVFVIGRGRIIKYNSAGEELWELSVSGDSMTVDNEGNTYVAGLGGGESVVKYDTNGKELWTSHPTDSKYCIDSYRIIVQGKYGSIYIKVNVGNSSDRELYIARYDSNTGDELWMIKHDASGISSMVVDDSDNLYIGGEKYLTKYNSNGTELWSILLGGTICALAIDPQGNIIVASYYRISKYSSSGKLIWVQHGYNQHISIALDGSGNVYSLGRIGSHEPQGAMIRKCSSNGGIRWSNGAYGGMGLYVDNIGNVYVIGGSIGRWFTTKYDSSGAKQWTAWYSDGSPHVWYEPAAFAVDVSGNIYVTGQSIYKECEVNELLNCEGGSTDYVEYTTIKYSQTSGPPISEPLPTTYTLTILPWECCEPYLARGEKCPCTEWGTCRHDTGCEFEGIAVDPHGGTYQAGTYVNVTVTESFLRAFDGWSGDAYGTSPTITIYMDSDKLIYLHASLRGQ